MQENGWIKIHSSLMHWEWWDDPAMVRAWIYMLLLANYKESRWMGYDLKAGSFATSLKTLSEQMHTTIDKTRTILDRLKRTGEITVVSNHHFTLISINNWEKYQGKPIQNPKPQPTKTKPVRADFTKEIPCQIPDKSQTNPKQIPTEEDYKDFKENIYNICPKPKLGESDLFGDAMSEPEKSRFSFEEFWDIYDKKVDKSACRSLYDKLPENVREEIRRHLPRYIESTPDKKYRKDPIRYIRHRCWEDEVVCAKNAQAKTINRDEDGF